MDSICRLCGSGNAFISLFTPKSRKLELLRNVIILSSGVQIREDDIVSKMVCQRCCEIAVKLHRYRSKAMSNDKLLKAQYGIPQAQSTNRFFENTLNLSNGHDNIDNTSDFSLQSIVADNTRNVSEGSIINRQSTITPQPKIVSRPKYTHPSVVRLRKQHPRVMIPREVYSDHVSPFITLDKSEVTDWYEAQVAEMKQKLPHIKFKKVNNVSSSSNIEKYNNKDSSTNNSVTNRNIMLKSTKDSTIINDQVKSIARATSDTNRNSSAKTKSTVRPTARKSTTMIKANVPMKITPSRKRSLSNSSTSTIGDYAAFFDNANSAFQSDESGSDRPKKKPCSSTSLKKKKIVSHSSSSSQTGFVSDKVTGNSKSLATGSTFKAVSAEKRKGSDRRDSSSSSQTSFISGKAMGNSKSLATVTKVKAEKRKGIDRKDWRDSSSTDLISDKGTQQSKSLETSTFKIVTMEKQKQRKDRNSSSSSSLLDIDDKPTEKWKESERKGRLMTDKLDIIKTERTSMIKSLLAEKREEIACPQKSENRAPKILQRARKKTAKLSATSKDKITENGTISKKKNKRYFNKDMVTDFLGFDTLDGNRSNRSEEADTNSTAVNALPGKSTSDSDSLFVLTSGKTLAVFICAVCSLVCDTKRQLVDHEKSHLTCKFCKVKIKNWQALIEHLNDTCIINVKQDNARVRLVRVDDNPSMVEKYRTAFQNDNMSDFEDNDDGGFDNNDDFHANVKDECDEEEPTLIKHEEVKLENTENEGEIICLSDTNDDDPAEFSVVQRHTIVQEEDIQIDDELKIINRTDENDIYLFDAMLKHHSSETEMIKTLFKKYYHGLIRFDKRSQTFRNSNRCVRRTSNNLILLERMLSELTVYIVAVNVECRASITARFNSPQTPPVSPLEYWGHKKTTCIVKRVKNKSAAKLKEISSSASDVKSQKRPPIQVVSVETKVPVNMSIEEITPPPQTSNAPIKSVLPHAVPIAVQLVNPTPPNSFQEAFITSSNIPTNTVDSVPIALIPAEGVQLLPNQNYDLIPTTSNALVPYCPSIPSTSGNQNNPIQNTFLVVPPNVLPSEAVIQDANCISPNQTDPTSSSNPATVE